VLVTNTQSFLTGGEGPPRKMFVLEKCAVQSLKLLDTVQKNVGPSKKTLRPSWCPKLVTGLTAGRANSLVWDAEVLFFS